MVIKNFFKKIYLKCKYGKKIKIGSNVTIDLNSLFLGNNFISDNSFFKGELGFSSYIGPNSYINGKVGNFCSIGSNVKIIVGNHPVDYVSTSPFTYSKKVESFTTFCHEDNFNEFKFADNEKKYHVIIGNDVWIGSNAIIMEGITIGDGAIIGAGAVVTKNVPPYAIVIGTPARILRYRFDDKTISYLIDIKWWDKDSNWIKQNIKYFSNINEFIFNNRLNNKK